MQGYGHAYYGHQQPVMHQQGGYGRSSMAGSPFMSPPHQGQVSYNIPVPKQTSGYGAPMHGGPYAYGHPGMMHQQHQRGYPPQMHHQGGYDAAHQQFAHQQFAQQQSFQHPHGAFNGQRGAGPAPFQRAQTVPNMYGGHAQHPHAHYQQQQGHFGRTASFGGHNACGAGYGMGGGAHPMAFQQYQQAGGQRPHGGFQQQQYAQGYHGFTNASGMQGVVVVSSSQGLRGNTTNWYIQDPYQQTRPQRAYSAQQMNMSDQLFEHALRGLGRSFSSSYLPLQQHGATTHMVHPQALVRGSSMPSLAGASPSRAAPRLLSVSHGIVSLQRTASNPDMRAMHFNINGATTGGRRSFLNGAAGPKLLRAPAGGCTDLDVWAGGCTDLCAAPAPNLDLHPSLLRSASLPSLAVDALHGGVGAEGPKFNFIVVRSISGAAGSRALGAPQQALPWGEAPAALPAGAARPQITHMPEGEYCADTVQGRIAALLGGRGHGMSVRKLAGGRSVCVYNRLEGGLAADIKRLVTCVRADNGSALQRAIESSAAQGSRALVPAVSQELVPAISQELVVGVQDFIARGATAGELLANGVTTQELIAAGVDSNEVAEADSSNGGKYIDLTGAPFGMPCNTFEPGLPTTVMWVNYSCPEGEGQQEEGEIDFSRLTAETKLMLFGTDGHDLDIIAQELLKGALPELANGNPELENGSEEDGSSPRPRTDLRLGAPQEKRCLGPSPEKLLLSAPPTKLLLTGLAPASEGEEEDEVRGLCATPRTPRDVCGTPRGTPREVGTPRGACSTPRGYTAADKDLTVKEEAAQEERPRAPRRAATRRVRSLSQQPAGLAGLLSASARDMQRVAISAVFMALVIFLALLTAFLLDVPAPAPGAGGKVLLPGVPLSNVSLYNASINASVNATGNVTAAVNATTVNASSNFTAAVNATNVTAAAVVKEAVVEPFNVSVAQFKASRYDAPLFDVAVSYSVTAAAHAPAPLFRRPHGPVPLQPTCYAKQPEAFAATPLHTPAPRLREGGVFAALGRALPFNMGARARPAPVVTPERRKNPIARSMLLFV